MSRKPNLLLSLFFGLFFGLFAYPILRIFLPFGKALLLAIWCALFCAVLLSLCLRISINHADRRYVQAEKAITSPILLRTSGNFILTTSVRNGRIYLCPDRLVFISLDKKPPIMQELSLAKLTWWESDDRRLYLYTDDGYQFISTPEDLLLLQSHLKTLTGHR